MRTIVSENLREIWERMSRSAAWHCANSRAGILTDAARDLKEWEVASEQARVAGEMEDLSPTLVDNIRWGIWNGAWHTANRIYGNQGDAQEDLHRWTRHWQSAHDQQELRSTLIDDTRWMAWNFAEWATNVRKGNQFWADQGYSRAICHAEYILHPPSL